MEIIAVARTMKQIQEITKKINNQCSDTIVHSFTDEMLAVKHVYQQAVDIIVLTISTWHLSIENFVRLVRKEQPNIRIYVLVKDGFPSDSELSLFMAGVDGVINEHASDEVIHSILNGTEKSEEEKVF